MLINSVSVMSSYYKDFNIEGCGFHQSYIIFKKYF